MQKHFSEVLNNCCNYDFIVNYDVANGDSLSQDLIQFYKDYVFFNWSSTDNIRLLDMIIFKYITETNFNKYLHDKYLESGDILPVFEILSKLYNEYEQDKIKMIDTTIWI